MTPWSQVLFTTFDITKLLKPGSNAVGALLGNSKWGYLDIYSNRTALGDQSGDSSRALLLFMQATLSNGTTLSLRSSLGDWYYRHGPIVYDHLWHGEIYDTRQETSPAWNAEQLHLYASGTWTPAKLMQPKVGAVYPMLMPPIRIMHTYTEADITNPTNATRLFDFKQNMAGFTTITVKPTEETMEGISSMVVKLKLKHAEITAHGMADNFYFPGMEFGHASKTCDMVDWYQRKWYKCANHTPPN